MNKPKKTGYLWKGKPVEDHTKEELIEMCCELIDGSINLQQTVMDGIVEMLERNMVVPPFKIPDDVPVGETQWKYFRDELEK